MSQSIKASAVAAAASAAAAAAAAAGASAPMTRGPPVFSPLSGSPRGRVAKRRGAPAAAGAGDDRSSSPPPAKAPRVARAGEDAPAAADLARASAELARVRADLVKWKELRESDPEKLLRVEGAKWKKLCDGALCAVRVRCMCVSARLLYADQASTIAALTAKLAAAQGAAARKEEPFSEAAHAELAALRARNAALQDALDAADEKDVGESTRKCGLWWSLCYCRR